MSKEFRNILAEWVKTQCLYWACNQDANQPAVIWRLDQDWQPHFQDDSLISWQVMLAIRRPQFLAMLASPWSWLSVLERKKSASLSQSESFRKERERRKQQWLLLPGLRSTQLSLLLNFIYYKRVTKYSSQSKVGELGSIFWRKVHQIIIWGNLFKPGHWLKYVKKNIVNSEIRDHSQLNSKQKQYLPNVLQIKTNHTKPLEIKKKSHHFQNRGRLSWKVCGINSEQKLH